MFAMVVVASRHINLIISCVFSMIYNLVDVGWWDIMRSSCVLRLLYSHPRERSLSPLSVLLHNTLISLHLSMYQRWIFLICKYVNYDLTTAIVRRVTFSRPVRVKTTLVCIQFKRNHISPMSRVITN